MISAQHKGTATAVLIVFFGLVLSFFINPTIVWSLVFVALVGLQFIAKPDVLLLLYWCWSAVMYQVL
jgi:hypothetical protein